MPANTTRRPDLDSLRVAATYLLFVFHSAKVYDVPPFYHVKNAVLSPQLVYLTGFIHFWHMPLFFVLAGWSAIASLRVRRPASFLIERTHRLFLPLVLGMLTIGPFLRWAELRTGQFRTLTGVPMAAEPGLAFLDYLPRYFTSPGQATWGHLWFLAYLLTYTLLTLPLLAWMARRPPGGTASRWLVYAPILPLAAIQLALRDRWPGFQNLIDDWANFAWYLTYFLCGAALACLPALERAAHERYRRAGLALLLAAFGIAVADGARQQGVAGAAAVVHVLSAVAGWCGVVALVGFAAARVRSAGLVLRWLTESAYPVYILHQPAVVGAALLIVPLPLAIPVKLALTIAASTLATLAVYEIVIRRVPFLRFLLGMRARPATPAPSPTLGHAAHSNVRARAL